MAAIHLLIPDTALRDAIAEGVKVTGLGETRVDADMAAALASDDAAIVLDEAAADRKALKAFNDAADRRKRVFLLGDPGAAWQADARVESFAKPLRLGHLLARVSFHLGSLARQKSDTVFGGWRFEPQNRQMTRQASGDIVRLTEKETALLDYLAQSREPVGREELLASVWGHDGRIDTHTLETHIYQLRRKLDPDGHLLANEGGAYCLKIG